LRIVAQLGLKVGSVGKVRFEERLDELVEERPELGEIMQPLLTGHRLHKKVSISVRED